MATTGHGDTKAERILGEAEDCRECAECIEGGEPGVRTATLLLDVRGGQLARSKPGIQGLRIDDGSSRGAVQLVDGQGTEGGPTVAPSRLDG